MLAAPNVVTTGHDSAKRAVFVESPEFKAVGPGVGVIYATGYDGGLVDTNGDEDLFSFAAYNPLTAGIIPRMGSTVLMVEFPAGGDSRHKTHRTLSVDIGVVLHGQVECHLDSGEKRLIRQGEILIQRGTKHFWANPSQTVPARVLFFVLPSTPVTGISD